MNMDLLIEIIEKFLKAIAFPRAFRKSSSKIDVLEYWIGKNTDYYGIWRSYENGTAYIKKYKTMSVHLLELKLSIPQPEDPLFNHEAVFKTLKGYFHDLKFICLSRDEYGAAGPIFLYSVDRGSGIWRFLGGLRELVLFGTTLSDEKLVGQRLENLDKKLKILREHFGGNLREEDFQRFMNATCSEELDYAVRKIFEQGIESVRISTKPYEGKVDETENLLIELKDNNRK